MLRYEKRFSQTFQKVHKVHSRTYQTVWGKAACFLLIRNQFPVPKYYRNQTTNMRVARVRCEPNPAVKSSGLKLIGAGYWVKVFDWSSKAQLVCGWAFSLLAIWCLRLPSFESCIQRRKATCLLSIRNHFLVPEHNVCMHASLLACSLLAKICILTSMFVWRLVYLSSRISRIAHERFDITSPNCPYRCTLAEYTMLLIFKLIEETYFS